jgi:hypothetical protein
MRSHLARRVLLAPVLGLALLAAACSSSSSPSASSSPATTAAAPASSSGGSSATATSLIETNWVNFFSGKTSAATKISLLQNGQSYASVIKAQASTPLAASASATVTAVVIESSTTATVSYKVGVSGEDVTQTGTAVLQGGVWKVGDVSFCALLKLEGSTPAACSSAG